MAHPIASYHLPRTCKEPLAKVRHDMVHDILMMTRDFGKSDPTVIAFMKAIYWTNIVALVDVCYTGEKSDYFTTRANETNCEPSPLA